MSQLSNTPLLNLSPAERPAAGTFPPAKSETRKPRNRYYNSSNPKQVNRETCAEKNQYQKCQQKHDHDRSPFPGAQVGHLSDMN